MERSRNVNDWVSSKTDFSQLMVKPTPCRRCSISKCWLLTPLQSYPERHHQVSRQSSRYLSFAERQAAGFSSFKKIWKLYLAEMGGLERQMFSSLHWKERYFYEDSCTWTERCASFKSTDLKKSPLLRRVFR